VQERLPLVLEVVVDDDVQQDLEFVAEVLLHACRRTSGS